MGIKTKIIDALSAFRTGNLFIQVPKTLHCNVDGTYYLYNGVAWVVFEMLAGLDYFELNAFGVAASSDGATAVDKGSITIVF